MRGIFNIIIGIVFIIGGLSGTMVIKGTQSSGGLAILGGVLLLFGIFRMAKPQ